MLTIAYLANLFPSAVEPYVIDEIEELRRCGAQVIAGSVRKPKETFCGSTPELVLQSPSLGLALRAAWLCVRRWERISDLLDRVVWRGKEGPIQRGKAILHTILGACYAAMLEPYGIDHIHAHHGYFGSWIAMVAARLLGVDFSFTLHGSDLLLHGVYLDVKLQDCAFCMTVSEYNRRYIAEQYGARDSEKVIVSRLGVKVNQPASRHTGTSNRTNISILSVGRLQAVKDHAFLVRACADLHAMGVDFECSIAGEGPERRHLESLIREYDLEGRVTLLGHVAREQMDSLYDRADVVVLTSRSEGLPLVLMEAMARGKVVLAPAITGIPEIVSPAKTGFLYQAGSPDDFTSQLLVIRSLMKAEHGSEAGSARPLHWVRHAARMQVLHNFNRQKNLESFANLFLSRVTPRIESLSHEDLVLQQI